MSLKKNVIANYLGQGWVALMGLAFIPVYIKYLGIEAYGLIGIFALLQAWLSLLDMGMTPTLSREMARFSGGSHSNESIRDLLRSIEIIALGIAIIIALTIWLSAEWLASNWLKAETLPISTVAQAFTIMGLITALRFMESLYRSSIIGLQRQVLLNIVSSVTATLKWAGAVGILAWVSTSIEAFFLWQGVITLLTLILYIFIVYNILPKAKRGGAFSVLEVKNIWRFASGMISITFLSLLLTQIDKILLSKILSLENFGYYSLAAMVAGALYILVQPITQAYFPRFSELIAQRNQAELISSYHKSAQMVSVVMGSAAAVLIFFAEPILLLWTQDGALVDRITHLVIILAIGNLLNALMWIPYQMQLAHGWTSYAVKVNIISVIILVPAFFWITPSYGAEGAALIWLTLNAGYVFIGIHFMHREILNNQKWHWYIKDIAIPLIFAFTIALSSSFIIPISTSTLLQIIAVIIALSTTFMITLLTATNLVHTKTLVLKCTQFNFPKNRIL